MTIKNLEGESIEKYATGVFRQYGIGGKDEKNGTLILISTEDRLIRIETGSGTEGFIPDARAGKIINEAAKPYLKDDNWDDGIRATFDAVLGCYLQEYNIEIDGSTASYVSADEEMSSSEMGWLIAIFSSFFFVPLIGSASEKSKTFAWIARIASIVTAIVSAIYVSQPTQAILFMICVLVFFATFGITASSGGGRRFGGSSFSSGGGGRSGGGGTSRGGGATGRF